MEPITTTKELAAVCTRLAKHPVVTVDTEFLRETTYFPILCVAQMASADEAVVVDAQAEGIDLAPFFKLMANEKVLKVFHAARQDIEIVWHRAKIIPHPFKAETDKYNAAIPALVNARAAAGKHITLVDLNTGFPSGALGSDNVHPNAMGYAWMGDKWYDATGSLFPK